MERLKKFLVERAERGQLPDHLVRQGIRRLCKERLDELSRDCESSCEEKWRFLSHMEASQVAPVPDMPNLQHYEVPASFFQWVLGPHRKYSCCLWESGTDSLGEAEAAALRVTCERAELEDGQNILELGCGWGSLTLWMAERYPSSRITAVSNSRGQREFIEQEAAKRGLSNVQILTSDMNVFEAEGRYDRVVSLEMFEHMRNYRELLHRISRWLVPGGELFIHIFCHQKAPYEFIERDSSDWMSRYFFTGGMMPSDDLPAFFQEHLKLERQWRWDGRHYQKTAEAWLENMDRHRRELLPILEETYGKAEAGRWRQRWRIFFMSCAELFGFEGGQQWWVSHYRFCKRA